MDEVLQNVERDREAHIADAWLSIGSIEDQHMSIRVLARHLLAAGRRPAHA